MQDMLLICIYISIHMHIHAAYEVSVTLAKVLNLLFCLQFS